jgi:hypothetical protein
MAGPLLSGYLQAKTHHQQQEELAEEKKRKKLADALKQLEFKQFVRGMDKAADEWRYQQRRMGEVDEAMERLLAGQGGELDYLIAGMKPEAKKEKPPWWTGTEFEPEYARKETYIAPEKRTPLSESQARARLLRQFKEGEYTPETHPWLWEYLRKPAPSMVPLVGQGLTVPGVTGILDHLYPKSEAYQELGVAETDIDRLWSGEITEPRTRKEEAFFRGREMLEDVLLPPRRLADEEIRIGVTGFNNLKELEEDIKNNAQDWAGIDTQYVLNRVKQLGLLE